MKLYGWQKRILNHKGDQVIRGGRQSGKSVIVAHLIYERAMQYPGGKSLIISSSERQENYIYETVKALIGSGYKGRSTLTLTTLINGHKIFKFPVGSTGKYLEGLASIDFLYGDEAIHIPPKVWDSILPMLAEPRKRGLGWITMLSSTMAKPKGYFFECFDNPKFLHTKVHAEECDHISKEFLEEERKRLGERFYQVVYGGEWDEEANHYFPSELVDRAKTFIFTKKDINKESVYCMGIDPAKYGKSKAGFAEAEIIGNGARVVYGEELEKSSFTEMRAKARDLQVLFRNKKIFFDSGGLGQGFDEFLEEDILLKRKLVSLNNAQKGKEFKILKEDLYSNVRRLLENGKLELADQKEIIDGLKGVEFEGPPGEEKIIGTDMSEAIVRALWGTIQKYIKLKILRF